MFIYEKKLQYPVKIKNCNPKLAAVIISQYGGPDGELGASMRYLTQRYGQPFNEVKGILTDIGTEELAHLEMICAMVHQLTRDLTPDDYIKTVFAGVYDKLDLLDEIISKNSIGWNIKRISKTALCVLRLAIYEIMFMDAIPVAVSINEAVELVKKYATQDDASFVNGILGSVSREEN